MSHGPWRVKPVDGIPICDCGRVAVIKKQNEWVCARCHRCEQMGIGGGPYQKGYGKTGYVPVTGLTEYPVRLSLK